MAFSFILFWGGALYGTVYYGQADHSGRQRQIRCSLHFQRRIPHGPGGHPGQLLCAGVLPRLYRRRPVRQPFESAHDQLLCLRLQLLREPQIQRHPPGHLRAPGAGGADRGILPPQLHRGTFSFQRSARHPGLHHRTDAGHSAAAAGRVPLRRLYPRQGHSRHQPGTAAAAGLSCRPPERECRAAQRAKPEPAGPGQGAALHLPAHEADRRVRCPEQTGADRLPSRAQVRARRAEHPDDRGRFAGDGLPHLKAHRGHVPEVQPEAGVLLRLHPGDRGHPPACPGHQTAAAAGAPAVSGRLAAAVLPVQGRRNSGRGKPEL